MHTDLYALDSILDYTVHAYCVKLENWNWFIA